MLDFRSPGVGAPPAVCQSLESRLTELGMEKIIFLTLLGEYFTQDTGASEQFSAYTNWQLFSHRHCWLTGSLNAGL
jgi:hypothetical protein